MSHPNLRYAAIALGAFAVSLNAAPALAFDGQSAPSEQISPAPIGPWEALQTGLRHYYSGDKSAALSSLQYAAEQGQPGAAWKLGEMYAHGDGVAEDDLKAFQYYSQIIRQHGHEAPEGPQASFVRSAFVALGNYYLHGIEGAVERDIAKAHNSFRIAAMVFGDAEAQYTLGQLSQANDHKMAVRWYNLAADKGHVEAQARLGETLFSLGKSDSNRASGLMWLTIAREQAAGTDAAWINGLHEQYFAVSSEPIRQQARIMADTWLKTHRPDLQTAQQVPTQ